MSPRTIESNESLKDAKRAAILRAATSVFARKGVSATRMEDIARTAGISAGLAYHYFPSKADLFHCIVQAAINRTIDAYQSALDSPGPGFQRLENLVRSVVPLAYGEKGIEQFLVINQAMTADDPVGNTRKLFDGGLAGLTGRLLPIFEQGHMDASIRPGSASAQVGILASLLQGLAILACLPDGRTTWFPTATEILDLFRAQKEVENG